MVHLLFPPLVRSSTVAGGPSSLVEDFVFSRNKGDQVLLNIRHTNEHWRPTVGTLDQIRI